MGRIYSSTKGHTGCKQGCPSDAARALRTGTERFDPERSRMKISTMKLGWKVALLVLALVTLPWSTSAQVFESPEQMLRLFETRYGFLSRNAGDHVAPFRHDTDRNLSSINGKTAGGSQSVSSLGNAISVEIDGSGNTVVINAEQINNGDQNATLILNGALALE